MTNFKYLLPFFLPFIFAPSVAFSLDEVENFQCPASPWDADKSEDAPQFAVQRIGELEIKRRINPTPSNPNSYTQESTSKVTIPEAKSREDFAERFFAKFQTALNIKAPFRELRVVRSHWVALRYKPYYNGLPVADSYFEFGLAGKNSISSFSMNEIPIERVATDKLPTDPSKTFAAVDSVGSKQFGPLISSSPPELVYAVRDGVAYPAWSFSLVYKGAPFVVVAFAHDHSIYSSKCTIMATRPLKTLLKERIL